MGELAQEVASIQARAIPVPEPVSDANRRFQKAKAAEQQSDLVLAKVLLVAARVLHIAALLVSAPGGALARRMLSTNSYRPTRASTCARHPFWRAKYHHTAVACLSSRCCHRHCLTKCRSCKAGEQEDRGKSSVAVAPGSPTRSPSPK